MPPSRFAPPAEVPGLAARRIAADILDGVLHKHRTLDEQLDGAGAHPGLKTLADRDRALMRRLVATILRRLGTLGHDLRFAFRVAKHVKSNTIIYAKDLATVGIGAGQMSRVDSARIAARKAEDAARELKLAVPMTKGSVVASDAFFPFADGMFDCRW